MRQVLIKVEGRPATLGHNIQVAETGFTRMRGLLGRTALAPGEGLWIRPSSGVHTIGMKFPIDVVGLDRSLRVVTLWNHLKPQRITSLKWKLASVVELPAGTIDHCALQLGDRVQITTAQELHAAD